MLNLFLLFLIAFFFILVGNNFLSLAISLNNLDIIYYYFLQYICIIIAHLGFLFLSLFPFDRHVGVAAAGVVAATSPIGILSEGMYGSSY